MKKKSLILPICAIVISLISSAVMILFTTDYLFMKSVNDGNINGQIKYAPLLEKAYEIDPCYSKLNRLKIIYNFQQIYHAPEDNAFYFDGDSIPEDFTEKSVKYSKLYYEFFSNPENVFKRKTLYAKNYAIPLFGSDLMKSDALVDYAGALYADGQKAESQKIIENWLNEEQDGTYGLLCKYVLVIHRCETDRDFQNWMVDIEEKATALVKQTNENITTDNLFLSNFEEYVPFEWQK